MVNTIPPPIPDDAVVHCPDPEDLGPLLKYLAAATAVAYVTPRAQAEPQVLTRLLREGHITALEVWRYLLARYDRSQSVSTTQEREFNSGWLKPVFTDQKAIWTALKALEAGDEPPPIPDLGRLDDHDIAQWQSSLMRQLHNLVGVGHVGSHALWDDLPVGIKNAAQTRLVASWFGGPYAVGAALAGLPSVGLGASDLGGRQGLLRLKTLVIINERELTALQRALKQDDASRIEEIQERLYLVWALLKGFVFAALRWELGAGLPVALLEHSRLVERVRRALAKGDKLLEGANPQGVRHWLTDSTATRDDRIAGYQLADLLAELVARLERERDRLSTPSSAL